MKGRGKGWFGDSAGHAAAARKGGKGRKKAGKVQIKSMKKAGRTLGKSFKTISAYQKSGYMVSTPSIARGLIREKKKAHTAGRNALKKINQLKSKYKF